MSPELTEKEKDAFLMFHLNRIVPISLNGKSISLAIPGLVQIVQSLHPAIL